ncbi:hypothetical protein [Erythrobacter aureus]|uniref:Uncharacterized protein n=1 Tax=Erythrobacter aureus TaxID=2182384 RepID=A0A345YIV7_9SPHN|nr:hypothetical protein [Erythrobacter aureus]AXK43859.1 hypothetical protein DVR09_15505 [Erythrobacter aureus]
MSHRNYSATAFAAALAAKTSTPILVLSTDGSNANSMRYDAIEGIDLEVKNELHQNDIAFVTYDSADEANAALDTLIAAWPESTTLSLIAHLGVPGQPTRVFDAIAGYEAEEKLAA